MGTNRDHRTLLTADETEPTIRLIAAVAELLEIDPVDCPPLYDVIEPTALNELFRDRPHANAVVSFEYAGLQVTIDGDGSIGLTDRCDS